MSPRSYITKKLIKDIRLDTIKSINEAADEYKSWVGEVDNLLSEVKAKKTIEKQAFIQACQIIETVASKIIKISALEACVKTGEFNYEPYVSHLLNAIDSHIDKIIKIDMRTGRGAPPKELKMKLDFTPLGTISSWISAITSFRGGKLGRTRGITKWKGKGSSRRGQDLASSMWREKIYMVDREGGQVIRLKKRTTVNKKTGEERTTTETINETAKFKGKYGETIRGRLSYLEPGTAPYWYLIEHGNSLLQFGGGTPYPKFAPTNFIRETELLFMEMWKRAYGQMVGKVEKVITSEFYKAYGIRGTSPSLDNAPKDVQKQVNKDIVEVARGYKRGKLTKGKMRVLKTIETTDVIYEEVYQRTGRLSLSRRNPITGRYM